MHFYVQDVEASIYRCSLRTRTTVIACMTTILERPSFIPSIQLLPLFIVNLMIIPRVIMHKLLPMRVNQPVLNAVIHMIPQFLIHREVLHPGCLINQINM
jgi:hypothetical protein